MKPNNLIELSNKLVKISDELEQVYTQSYNIDYTLSTLKAQFVKDNIETGKRYTLPVQDALFDSQYTTELEESNNLKIRRKILELRLQTQREVVRTAIDYLKLTQSSVTAF